MENDRLQDLVQTLTTASAVLNKFIIQNINSEEKLHNRSVPTQNVKQNVIVLGAQKTANDNHASKTDILYLGQIIIYKMKS